MIDNLVFAARFPLEVDHIERLFCHLLNDHSHLARAPDEVGVSYVHEHVDFKLANLALFLCFFVLHLPFSPIGFDLSIAAIVDKLTNYVIDFECCVKWFVSQNDLLGSPEVAHEARWLVNKVTVEAGLAVSVPTQSSDALLHKFEANRADKLIEGVFSHFELSLNAEYLTFGCVLRFICSHSLTFSLQAVEKLLEDVVRGLKVTLNLDPFR